MSTSAQIANLVTTVVIAATRGGVVLFYRALPIMQFALRVLSS